MFHEEHVFKYFRTQSCLECSRKRHHKRTRSPKLAIKISTYIKFSDSNLKNPESKMNNPESYQQSNSLQKRDTLICLKEYATKINWGHFDSVVDIGCGDGGVTTEILTKFIASDFKELVGCDKSKRMVEFANEYYSDHRTAFMVLDIEGDLPVGLMGRFDHAFSFFTLHWTINQERALTNIYDLLTPDGDCFMVFAGRVPLYEAYRKLSRCPKWRPWLRHVERFVSPYHDSQKPEVEVHNIMKKIGFRNIEVKVKEMSYVFNGMEVFKKSIAAVNPFVIPADLKDDFLEDCIRNTRLVFTNHQDDRKNVEISYSLLVAYGTK